MFRLHLTRNLFHLTHDPQKVSTENLVNLLTVVAPLKQFRGDLRQIGDRIDAFGQRGHAVEVGAEAHMVDARDFGDVVDMVDQGFQRRTGELRGPVLRDGQRVVIVQRAAIGVRMRFGIGINLFGLLSVMLRG